MTENPYDSPAEVDATRPHDANVTLGVLATIAAAGVLFTSPLLLTLMVFFSADVILFAALLLRRQPRAASLSALAAILVYATYEFTVWGFSSNPPTLRVAWGWLIPTCAVQFGLTSLPAWRGLVLRKSA